AAQSRQIHVINDALAKTVTPKAERLMEEAFHPKAIKNAVKFQIPPFKITQIEQANDKLGWTAGQLDRINRGVVLHLQARFVGHLLATGTQGRANAQF